MLEIYTIPFNGPNNLLLKKSAALVICLFLLVFAGYSQQSVDVLKTKKGSEVRGEIFHRDDSVVKIRTADGSVFAFEINEIESISQAVKPVSPTGVMNNRVFDEAAYSRRIGYGGSFGDGLLFTVRYAKTAKQTFQFSGGLGATWLIEEDPFLEAQTIAVAPGLVLEAGANFYGKRKLKPSNFKYKAHGLAIRLGQLMGDYSTTQATIGWTQEIMRVNNMGRSFNFELGAKALFPQWEEAFSSSKSTNAMLYARFHWNWYAANQMAASQKPPITIGAGDVISNSGNHVEPPADQTTPTKPANPPQPNNPNLTQSSKRSTPMRKGSIMVASATGLANNATSTATGGRNSAGFSTSEQDGVKYTTTGLSPNAGYFLSDNLLGGVSLSLVSAKAKEDGRTETSSLFAFGPFVRYYGNLPNPKLKWTAEAALAFGSAKNKVKVFDQVYENVDGLFSLSLGPGLAYFLGERVTVEVQGVYERLSVKDKETKEEKTQGSYGLRIGFGVFL